MTETAPAGAPETPTAAPQEPAQSAPTPPVSEAKAEAAKAPEAPAKAPYVNPYAGRAPSKPAPVAAPATTPPATPDPATPDPAMVERIAVLEAQTKAATEALAGFASQALADVSESVRKVVSELAGEDPAKQLSTLAALRRNGLATGPVPQGTTTAPSAPAPTPPSARDEDAEALDTYRKLEASAPFVAATFRATHGQRIDRALARTKPS